MGVGLLGLHLKCGCEGRQEWSALAKEGRFGAQNAPASQTLIVLSDDPDTILVPSGENDTDVMGSLWALAFTIFCSNTATMGRPACEHSARVATGGVFLWSVGLSAVTSSRANAGSTT